MKDEKLLPRIQSEIKAPKGQFNSFGKYKYRSCEDIVEAVKPVLHKLGFYLVISDEVVQVGERIYFKATATISNGSETYSATGFAREEDTKKGMDASQLSGATSSYARKYALNGLFAIDDTEDSDATNTGGAKPSFTSSHPHFQAAIDGINAGKGTLAMLEDKFSIDAKTKDLILSKLTV